MLTRPQCPSRSNRYSDGPSGYLCPTLSAGAFKLPLVAAPDDLLSGPRYSTPVVVTQVPWDWSHRLGREALTLSGGHHGREVRERSSSATYRLVIDLGRFAHGDGNANPRALIPRLRLATRDHCPNQRATMSSVSLRSYSHNGFDPATVGLAEAPSRADFRLA